MNNLKKSGQDNQPAGTYIEVGPRGGAVPNPRIIRIETGDRLPPVSKAKNRWKKI